MQIKRRTRWQAGGGLTRFGSGQANPKGATSATDEAEEAEFYRRIADTLPAAIVISIGHRA